MSFAPLVHHIQLHDHGEEDRKLETWFRVFLPCFSLFKSVKSLSLPYFAWGTAIEARSNFFACFRGISELFIGDGCFLDTSAFARLALQFPLLERLELEDIAFVNKLNHLILANAVPNDVRVFPSLRSLSIGGYKEPIIRWFLSLERIPSLYTLCMAITCNEWESVGRFIRVLAPTLKHLTVYFLRETSFLIQSASQTVLFCNTI
jgi:hypothetical protein